ncbi:MAG: hypothetical protein D6692_14790, partial [Planctomycetota bacterium]
MRAARWRLVLDAFATSCSAIITATATDAVTVDRHPLASPDALATAGATVLALCCTLVLAFWGVILTRKARVHRHTDWRKRSTTDRVVAALIRQRVGKAPAVVFISTRRLPRFGRRQAAFRGLSDLRHCQVYQRGRLVHDVEPHPGPAKCVQCNRSGPDLICPSSSFCWEHHPSLKSRGGTATACSARNSLGRPCRQYALGRIGNADYDRCAAHLTDAQRNEIEESGALRTSHTPTASPAATTGSLRVNADDYDATDGARIPTLRRVPYESVGQLTAKVRLLLRGYATADSGEKERMTHALLSLPKIFLRQANDRHVGATIRRLGKQLVNVPAVVVIPEAETISEKTDRRIRAARKKAREGYSGRAARILFREEITSTLTTAEKLAKLKALHPSVEGTDGTGTSPIHTGNASLLDISDEKFVKVVRRGCRGSTSGRTGWTEELLLQVVSDELALAALKPLLLDIANNRISETVRRRLTACNLSALPKKDNGIRPIAVGEVLLKLVSAYVLSTLEDEVAAFFRPIQLGIGTPGGCERIIHTLRRELTPASIVCTVDFRNAFNMPLRSAMKAALESHPGFAPLYDLFNLAYGTPSELHYEGDIVWSRRGSRQGDPLGGFLFCLLLHSTIAEAQRRFPTVRLSAYMDDISLHSPTGDSEAIIQCFDLIAQRSKAMGMEVREDKCEWFSRSPMPPG